MSKSFQYVWRWNVKHSVDQVWQHFLALGHRAIAHPIPTPIIPKQLPRPSPAAWLFGGIRDNESCCINWVESSRLDTKVVYSTGLLSEINCEISLDGDTSSCSVTYQLNITPKSLLAQLAIPFLIGIGERKRLTRTFIDLNRSEPMTVKAIGADSSHPGHNEPIQELVMAGFDAAWVNGLMDIIKSTPEPQAHTLRPYIIGDELGIPRRRALELFLQAAERKLLELYWIIECPSCGLEEQHIKSLSELDGRLSCLQCNQSISLDATSNLELCFRPHPSLRSLKKVSSTDPIRHSHVLLQKDVTPGNLDTTPLSLNPGHYRLRSTITPSNQWYNFEVDKRGLGELFSAASKEELQIIHKHNTGASIIKLSNRLPDPVRFILEDCGWRKLRVMAIDALTCQTFRELCRDQVPRPDATIQIPTISLLFTRLMKPTSAIQGADDINAFKALQELFSVQKSLICSCDGAVIKTMNDATVAAFQFPEQALDAAVAIQRDLQTFNTSRAKESRMEIKVALHQGSCVAVNFNNLCDFFGQTVSTTRAIRDCCPEGEVVISGSMKELPQTVELLQRLSLKTEELKLEHNTGEQVFRICEATEFQPLPKTASITRLDYN